MSSGIKVFLIVAVGFVMIALSVWGLIAISPESVPNRAERICFDKGELPVYDLNHSGGVVIGCKQP